MKVIQVWDIQTRIFHWSLVVFVLCSLVTADFLRFFGIDLVNKDAWLAFHIGTGTAVGILLSFRIFWGLRGPRYSRFNSLRLSIAELCAYFHSVIKNVKTSYTGHNPAASWSALCIIALGLLEVISGAVVFGLDERRGMLGFLYLDFHSYADSIKLLHLGFAYALMAIIFGHICGVLNETIRHKTGIIMAMLSGKKLSDEPETPFVPGASLATVSFAWVLSPFIVAIYFSTSMETRQPINLEIPPIYRKECGSCHMAFPPNALPAESWKHMMANLMDHFGDDASIDETAQREIEAYLVQNSAERSHEEPSIKFLRSIGTAGLPLRITDIPYWKEKHKPLDQSIYGRVTIKSRINCVACHKWSEYGSFEDSDIRIPKN
ncbi:dihaem cytochrome c [Geobacter sp. OR-1]|uniref:cytochrome b/b6 domain-containing protein n=1 Tax=Geobacter sp. OR-1 TaxID=1266765 RepID=UPI00054366E1|nr:cytochrome b/b6 domain-containing protein [Geobacter sp. OR-1]GAM09495.1 dihaem cytochrome c [Geobacter sp. OR-1]